MTEEYFQPIDENISHLCVLQIVNTWHASLMVACRSPACICVSTRATPARKPQHPQARRHTCTTCTTVTTYSSNTYYSGRRSLSSWVRLFLLHELISKRSQCDLNAQTYYAKVSLLPSYTLHSITLHYVAHESVFTQITTPLWCLKKCCARSAWWVLVCHNYQAPYSVVAHTCLTMSLLISNAFIYPFFIRFPYFLYSHRDWVEYYLFIMMTHAREEKWRRVYLIPAIFLLMKKDWFIGPPLRNLRILWVIQTTPLITYNPLIWHLWLLIIGNN